jgi:hypothetical protein
MPFTTWYHHTTNLTLTLTLTDELVTLKKDHLLLLETHPSVLKYVSPSNVKLHNVWLPKSVAFKCDTAVAMGYDGSTLANVM